MFKPHQNIFGANNGFQILLRFPPVNISGERLSCETLQANRSTLSVMSAKKTLNSMALPLQYVAIVLIKSYGSLIKTGGYKNDKFKKINSRLFFIWCQSDSWSYRRRKFSNGFAFSCWSAKDDHHGSHY